MSPEETLAAYAEAETAIVISCHKLVARHAMWLHESTKTDPESDYGEVRQLIRDYVDQATRAHADRETVWTELAAIRVHGADVSRIVAWNACGETGEARGRWDHGKISTATAPAFMPWDARIAPVYLFAHEVTSDEPAWGGAA